MKRKNKTYPAAAVGCLLAALLSCSITPANSSSENTTLSDAAVICPEGVTVSRDTYLDYTANTWEMKYLLENTAEEEASCTLLVPVATTLKTAEEGLLSFRLENGGIEDSFKEELYFSPLFSSASISEDNITAEQLYAFHEQTLTLPSDSGTLYTLRCNTPTEEDTPVLTIQTDNDAACRIYPIGCTYTASDGNYEISAEGGSDICYLFVTGKEGTDYTAAPVSESDFELSEEDSSLDAFMKQGCDLFWEKEPLNPPAAKENLLTLLSSYLEASNVTVALDLIPSLEWLSAQKLFEVYSCTVSIAPGTSACVSVFGNCTLAPGGVSVNPVLTNNGTPLAANRIHIRFCDDYTGASLRKAKGSFNKDESVLTIKDASDGVYQIVLSKTPVWVKTYKYIIPMCIVMAVFLLLCIPAYLGRKKASSK